MGCHVLLQGIFWTQGSNLSLLHCRQILYHLSHQGSPRPADPCISKLLVEADLATLTRSIQARALDPETLPQEVLPRMWSSVCTSLFTLCSFAGDPEPWTKPKCPTTREDPASYGHVATGRPPATRKSEAPYT